ncbi:DUF3148 domain-containing protein [Spirulina sp. CS-785/01]|uniref:regulatory protein SipA n=1 Tax=Spirulina sp. CS-785/01 TaxID=3021716 RepID=UPI00233006A0|nr:DUF3148 domain-containing protein [Spirulina sp. CS-785/01]MDB9314523.1 DUF3148 domain-containing protein [Spirulina sp. CS-785/01]
MSSSEQLKVGQSVRLMDRPPYFKTADPMPMLRPADIVQIGEEGKICDRKPGGYWAVRFEKGTFLLDAQYLEIITPQETPTPSEKTSSQSDPHQS